MYYYDMFDDVRRMRISHCFSLFRIPNRDCHHTRTCISLVQVHNTWITYMIHLEKTMGARADSFSMITLHSVSPCRQNQSTYTGQPGK